MPRYEYKVVPAPIKGLKGKGVKGPQGRFAYAVQELMNGLSGYGWEYQRSETLPSTERSGLTGSTTEWRNVLVFRRLREGDAQAFAPELLPAPVVVPHVAPVETQDEPSVAEKTGDEADSATEADDVADVAPEADEVTDVVPETERVADVAREAESVADDTPQADSAADVTPEAEDVADAPQTETPQPQPKKNDSFWDNGVEDTNDVTGIGRTLEILATKRKSIKSKD